jgi:hypothetical protein
MSETRWKLLNQQDGVQTAVALDAVWNRYKKVAVGIFAAVLLKMAVFWVETPSSLAEI